MEALFCKWCSLVSKKGGENYGALYVKPEEIQVAWSAKQFLNLERRKWTNYWSDF